MSGVGNYPVLHLQFISTTHSLSLLPQHFLSRFTIIALGKIIDNVSQFEGDFVLDGEICLIDEFGNDDFQGIMKEIKRKDHTIQNRSWNRQTCFFRSNLNLSKPF